MLPGSTKAVEARPGAEFVDVELVVGEEHEVLEMVGARRRVVAEPRQRIVDALRGKGGERRGLARPRLVGAVGDLVIGVRQVRRVEEVSQRQLDVFRDLRLHIGAFAEGEMQRDRRRRFGNRDARAVVAHQKAELFLEIVAEEFRPRDGRRVDAGRGDVAIGEARIDMAEARCHDRDLRISGAKPGFRRAVHPERHERVGQERGVALIECLERIDGRHRIIEGFRLVGIWRCEREGFSGEDSFAHGSL